MKRTQEDPKAWIETTYRRVMLAFNFRDPEATEIITGKPVSDERRAAMQRDVDRYLDPEIYIRAFKRMGIQVMYHHTKGGGGVSCYATRIGHRFSLMGDRDFFGELVTACRRAGIVPGAMFQVGRDTLRAAQHPDWLLMDVAGKRCVFNMCSNNPNWRGLVMAQVEELAHYDIGAIVFDQLLMDYNNIQTACYCPHCRELFRRDAGEDMPEQEDWDNPVWRRFVQWRYDRIVGFIEEADAVLKRVNPDIAHACIYRGNPTREWKHGYDCDRTAPIYTYLVNDVAGVDRVAFRARVLRALSARRPELAAAMSLRVGSYTHYGYCDNSVPKPRDMFFADVMTALANGVTPAFESLGWRNRRFWDKRKATMCSPAFDRAYLETSQAIQRREPWLTGAEPVRHAVVLHSRRTRDMHYHSQVEPYTESLVGWHEALLQGQVLHDLTTEGRLNAEGLRPYKLLVLPNISCLSDDQAETIRAYVKAGGGLVASFGTSLFDETGKERADFALGDVFGVTYAGNVDNDYVLRKEHPAQRDQYFISVDRKHKFFQDVLVPGERMSCPAPTLWVRPRPGAQPVGRFTIHWQEGGKFEGQMDWISGRGRPEATDYPVLVANRFGKGRAVYLSAKLAASFKIHGHPLLHPLLLRAARWAGGRPAVEVDAPASVEANAYVQDAESRVVVHLVNYQTNPSRGMYTGRMPPVARVLPVRDLTVTARVPRGRKVKKVYLAPDKRRLKWTQETGSRISIAVPEIHIHGMAVVEYA